MWLYNNWIVCLEVYVGPCSDVVTVHQHIVTAKTRRARHNYDHHISNIILHVHGDYIQYIFHSNFADKFVIVKLCFGYFELVIT